MIIRDRYKTIKAAARLREMHYFLRETELNLPSTLIMLFDRQFGNDMRLTVLKKIAIIKINDVV